MLDPYKQLQINGKLNTLQVVQMLRDMDKRIKTLEDRDNEKETKVSSNRRATRKDAGESLSSA